MNSLKRKVKTVSILPERKHGRPPGNRLITRSTTLRPLVYNLPESEPSQEVVSPSKKSRRNQGKITTNKRDSSVSLPGAVKTVSSRKEGNVSHSLLKSFSTSSKMPGKDTPKAGDAQNIRLHQALQEISANGEALVETGAQSAKKNLDTPRLQSPSHLVPGTIVCSQRHSAFSLTAADENNFQEEKSDVDDKCKSNLRLEVLTLSTKQSSQWACPNIRTSTPIKLKTNGDNERNSLQILTMTSAKIPSTEVRGNEYLIEPNSINKENNVHNSYTVNTSEVAHTENTNCTSHEILWHRRLQKCKVVLEKLPIALHIINRLTKEMPEGVSSKEKEKKNGGTPNRGKGKTGQKAMQDGSSAKNETQNEHIAREECLVSGNKDIGQGEMIVESTAFANPSVLDVDRVTTHSSTSNRDNDHEPFLVSSAISSKIANVCSPPEKSISQETNQPDFVQNDNSQIGISDIFAELQNEKPRKPSKSSPSSRRAASETNKHPQNVVSSTYNEEPTALVQNEPLVFQEKELGSPSNKLVYTMVTNNTRKAASRQPRKPRRGKKPDGITSQISDRRPLFEEQKEIKVWKGKGRVGDVCDLDIAENIIDEVIEEIREEDESKEELLYQVRKKYQDSLHKMILKIGAVKRRDREIEELMASIKDLIDELDKKVDKKFRLKGMILESKAQKITKSDGPTWEDFSKF